MSDRTGETTMVREVRLSYRGRAIQTQAITKPEMFARYARARIGIGEPREHFLAVFLDSRHVPIGSRIVSIGTVNASLVHAREVFQPAILAGAVAVIVGHNHPSGNTTPSDNDRALHKKLRNAGDILGIEVLDHVIWTDHDHWSMRDEE